MQTQTSSRRKLNVSGTGTKDAGLELLKRDFAYHCLRLRKQLRITQAAFGQLMGVENGMAKVTVARWESGKHSPQKRFLTNFMKLQRKHDGGR